jgi:hypothetical protein
MVRVLIALLLVASASAVDEGTAADMALLKQLKSSKVFSGVVEKLEAGSPADDILRTLKQVVESVADERKQTLALKVETEAQFMKEITGNRRVLNATRAALAVQVKCVEGALEQVLKVSDAQDLISKSFVSQATLGKWTRKAQNISRVRTRLEENFKADVDDLAQRKSRHGHATTLVEHVIKVIESHYSGGGAAGAPHQKVSASLLELAALAPEATESVDEVATQAKSESAKTGSQIMEALTKLQSKFEAQAVMLEEEKAIVTRDYKEKKLHLGTAFNETWSKINVAQARNKENTVQLEKLRNEKRELEATKGKCSKKMSSLQAIEKKDLLALQESKAAMKAKLRIYNKNLELIQSQYELANWVMELVMKRVQQIRNIIKKAQEARLKEKLKKGEAVVAPKGATGGAGGDDGVDVQQAMMADKDVQAKTAKAATAEKDVAKKQAAADMAVASGDAEKLKQATAELEGAKAGQRKAEKDVEAASVKAAEKAEKDAAPVSPIEAQVVKDLITCPFSKTDTRSPCYPGGKCEKAGFSTVECSTKTKLYCLEVGAADAACVGAMAKKKNITVCANFAPVDTNEEIDHATYKEMCEGKRADGQEHTGCTYRKSESGGIGMCLNEKCLSGPSYWCQSKVTRAECRVTEEECSSVPSLEAPKENKGLADQEKAIAAAQKDAEDAKKKKRDELATKAAAVSAEAAAAAKSVDDTKPEKPAVTAAKAEDAKALTEKEKAKAAASAALSAVKAEADTVAPARFKAVKEGATVPAPQAVKAMRNMLRHN